MHIDSHLICGCKYICPLRFSVLVEKTCVLNVHLRALERLSGNKMSVVCLFSTLVSNVIERNCVLERLGMLALGICPSGWMKLN